jgi:hypothetical protein
MALLGIPHTARTLSLPNDPVYKQTRAEASRALVAQCVLTSVLLVICVRRWHAEAALLHHTSAGKQVNRLRHWYQFSTGDIFVWATALAVCLSLWKWLGSWLLAMVIGTCALQADVLRRRPVRLRIVVAWLAAWAVVAVMIAMCLG